MVGQSTDRSVVCSVARSVKGTKSSQTDRETDSQSVSHLIRQSNRQSVRQVRQVIATYLAHCWIGWERIPATLTSNKRKLSEQPTARLFCWSLLITIFPNSHFCHGITLLHFVLTWCSSCLLDRVEYGNNTYEKKNKQINYPSVRYFHTAIKGNVSLRILAKLRQKNNHQIK